MGDEEVKPARVLKPDWAALQHRPERTTNRYVVTLPEAVHQRLECRARSTKRTKASLVREFIVEGLGRQQDDE